MLGFFSEKNGLVLTGVIMVALISLFLNYLVNSACNLCHRKNYETITDEASNARRPH